MDNINKLKQKLGIEINTKTLREVLLHTSYLNESKNKEINKEILIKNKIKSSIGNSIVKLMEKIYYIKETKYEFSRINDLLNEENILECFYDKYNLEEYMYLGKGEKKNSNRIYIEHAKMIIYEIYIENGLIKTYEFLKDFIKQGVNIDYKTMLQEYAQKFHKQPIYDLINTQNGKNCDYFTVRVSVLGKSAVATYSTKKGAEKMAAQKFCENNNINISYESKKLELLRCGKKWNVSNIRKQKIDSSLKVIIDENNIEIPEYIRDACLTHRSVQSFEKDTNKIFVTLGAEILNIYVQMYLLDNVDRYINSDISFDVEKAMILKNDNLEKIIVDFYGKKWLKGLEFEGSVDYKKLGVETYKSILGAMIFYCFFEKQSMIDNIDKFYKKSIEDLEIINLDIDINDYSNWLMDLIQHLNISIYKKDEASYGLEHNKKYYAKLIMNLEIYGLSDLEVESESSSKDQLNFNLAKNMYLKLRNFCDLSNDINLLHTDEYNVFLGNMIDYISIKNNFFGMKLGLLGIATTNKQIIQSLYNRKLYKQIKIFVETRILDKNEIKKISDFIPEINLFVNNEFNKVKNENELYLQKNILLKQNTKFIDQVMINQNKYYRLNKAKVDVLFELYSFEDNKCNCCNQMLEKKNKVVITKTSEGIYPILSEVSYCPNCNIYGISKSQYKNENEYKIYYGSKNYYSSCRLEFDNLSFLILNKSEFNEDKKINLTVKNLNKKIKLTNKIRLKGQELIFDYEKQRLLDNNKLDLAQKIELINQEDNDSGYDILSYDFEGNKIYIKVKCLQESKSEFYLTREEIEAAKKYGDSYYIYKVNNVIDIPYIDIIKNPFKCVELGKVKIEAVKFLVNIV